MNFQDYNIIKFLERNKLIPDIDDEIIRNHILTKIDKIVQVWIAGVAELRKHQRPSALVLYHGSYGLQVHSPTSDLDIVVVGPSYASLEDDFLIGLYKMITTFEEATNIESISTAKVPLIKFNFHNIKVEIVYAQLSTIEVVKAEEFSANLSKMKAIGRPSESALSSIQANLAISRYVPSGIQGEHFMQALRLIKFWANKRGLYGNVIGYLGGIHLAAMMALVFSNHPSGSLATQVSRFFAIYSSWKWPAPVVLEKHRFNKRPPVYLLMPIQKPGSLEFLQSNATEHTKRRIQSEFDRASLFTQDLPLELSNLCDPFNYRQTYDKFLKIRISADEGENSDSLERWTGLVRSRFPNLLRKLSCAGISCDPTLTEYRDNIPCPNKVYLWGIIVEKERHKMLSSVRDDFKLNLGQGGDIYLAVIPSCRYATYKPL